MQKHVQDAGMAKRNSRSLPPWEKCQQMAGVWDQRCDSNMHDTKTNPAKAMGLSKQVETKAGLPVVPRTTLWMLETLKTPAYQSHANLG